MSDFDWNGLGSSIRDLVQDAVDTRDFEKLSSNINRMVQQAMDGVSSSVRDAGLAAGRVMDETARNLRGQPGGRTGTGYNGKVGYANYSRRASEARQNNQPRASFQAPALFVNTRGSQVGGIVMAVVGYVLGLMFGIVFLFSLIGLLVSPIGDLGVWAVMFSFGGLTAASLFTGVKGSSQLMLIQRFQNYVRALGGRTFCELRELASGTGKDLKYIRRDLRRMMAKNWFLEGHLDQQETCLIVTNDTYQQYLSAERQRKLRMQEEEQHLEEQGNVPEQVKEVLEAGNAYIRRIRKCNDDIPGEEISAKISRTEQLVQQIFTRVEEHPETVPDIRKLMEYYLPTTVKLLDAYAELDAQPVEGEHIASSKKEIEDALDTLNTAFEKLLDSLFRDTAWDVSADISVLQTMLAQEGLTNNDFRRDSK